MNQPGAARSGADGKKIKSEALADFLAADLKEGVVGALLGLLGLLGLPAGPAGPAAPPPHPRKSMPGPRGLAGPREGPSEGRIAPPGARRKGGGLITVPALQSRKSEETADRSGQGSVGAELRIPRPRTRPATPVPRIALVFRMSLASFDPFGGPFRGDVATSLCQAPSGRRVAMATGRADDARASVRLTHTD